MKLFIITGATSMIGIALCQYLSSFDGHLVYAVCREDSNGLKRLPVNANIKVVYSDLKYIDDIAKVIDRADVFINLAWTNTDQKGRNSAILQGLNVDYAKEAIRVAALKGCKLFVEAGSQAEYGFVEDLITEETPCNPELEYGKAKLRVFNEGSLLCESVGLKYLHLRIFSTFGENDRPWTLIMSAIDKMLKNEDLELSSCKQNWNYLYVTDCAKQIFLLCQYLFNKSEFKLGVYHIASKDTRSLKNYMEEMKSVLKSSSVLHYGSIVPAKQVSLNPSVTKTENAIRFTNEISFADAIKLIVRNNYNIQL
ncbi:MAG: NAD(P)-dependent oxidoreductase [Mariniphaga sp.]|nr:NAD(P)-dependent oxidoreductase [Mariniphaga sp.]